MDKEQLREKSIVMITEALEILASSSVDLALNHVLKHIQEMAGCRYAAIRIIDEHGNIPFYVHDLDPGFYDRENWLTINDCMCGRVARGDVDATLPFFTEAGSFFVNSTTKLLATASEEEKGATRNTCNMMGYESVGIFPIKAAGEITGELYLSDYREDVFAPEAVDAIEKVCARIGGLTHIVKQHYVLIDSKKHVQRVLDNISQGILSHDMNRRIISFNKAAEEITGYRSSEVIGRDCHDVFPGGFCLGLCDFRDEQGAGIRPSKHTIDILTKSGEKRRVEMSMVPIDGSGSAQTGIMLSFRDLTREFEVARRLVERADQFSGIIGRDKKMLEVFDLISDLSGSNLPVLIQGESGTGKELVAAAIHKESLRRDRLFVPVNCGALPDSLIESELFGHVKGAFTGAVRDKKGRFELADGGTIFLDEIGEISQAMQVKLLRVLQEGTFERVGGEKTLKVDVRVISATNKDLSQEVAVGRFRQDLFYRLCVANIELPPLRERRNDIPLLIEHFLARETKKGRDIASLSAEAIAAMLDHSWPGNIRELENALQFALIRCKGKAIGTKHLPPTLSARVAPKTISRKRSRKRKLQGSQIEEALAQTGGNKARAAKLLGVSRATLYRFLATQEDSENA
jgi:PAS domain S-box-containing protein